MSLPGEINIQKNIPALTFCPGLNVLFCFYPEVPLKE
jgi:hypothetical protein